MIEGIICNRRNILLEIKHMRKMLDESGEFECPESGFVSDTIEKGIVVVGLTALGLDAATKDIRKKLGNSLAELIATLTGEKPKF